MNRRLLLWICVVTIAPIFALLLIELVMRMYGVFQMEPFLRGLKWLGPVEALVIRKQIFLIAFGIVVVVLLGLMIYAITSIFDILSEEPAQRARRDSRRK